MGNPPKKEVNMTTQGVNVDPEYQREKVTVKQSGGVEHEERIIENKGAEMRLFTYRITQLIMLVFVVLEGLIGFRILLKLIDANPANLFAQFIYQLTGVFLTPFANLINNPVSSGMVVEVTSLIAMLVYFLLCWVLVTLVRLVFLPTKNRTVTIVNKEQS
jgi:hypothetical protein